MLSFPADWPPGCPPNESTKPDGLFYRAVKSNPPTGMDFLSWHEQNRQPEADPCRRVGVSVLSGLSDAKYYRMKYRKHKYIACGYLDSDQDRIHPTPTDTFSSHHTWWTHTNTGREAYFTILEGQ